MSEKLSVYILTLFIFTTSPTLAAECVYDGNPEDLLRQINHTDDVIDIDSIDSTDAYLSCIFDKDSSQLTDVEEKIKDAYYDLYERDPLYTGALEYDEALW